MREKNYVLLAVFCFILAFTACSKDDDDNGPAFAPDGKRLVKSIIGTSVGEYSNERRDYFFSYNGDGQITVFESKWTYMSDELDKECTDTERVTYSVSGKNLTVVTNYVDGEDSEYSDTYTGKFILNGDGYVESGEEIDVDEDEFTYKYYYDNTRHLEKLDYTRNGRNEGPIYFIWEKENLVKGVYNRTYTYFDKENKGNIDLADLCGEIWVLGFDRSYLGMVEYLGKRSKYLMKSTGEINFTYEYDSEGYVTKVTVVDKDVNDSVYVYQINYN